MKNKNYRLVTGIVFAIIAAVHLTRIIFGWEVSIAGWMVPQWLSWAAFLITGGLFHASFKK
ncbi:MAG: hypothetical protein Q7S32_01860 [bacterium]|nr:hypothetical protein [bacterium]